MTQNIYRHAVSSAGPLRSLQYQPADPRGSCSYAMISMCVCLMRTSCIKLVSPILLQISLIACTNYQFCFVLHFECCNSVIKFGISSIIIWLQLTSHSSSILIHFIISNELVNQNTTDKNLPHRFNVFVVPRSSSMLHVEAFRHYAGNISNYLSWSFNLRSIGPRGPLRSHSFFYYYFISFILYLFIQCRCVVHLRL